MKKYIAILLALALLCFAGCESAKRKGERTTNHKELYGRTLTFPANGEWYAEGRDTIINISNNLKIVTYYDSEGCVPCKLKELNNWKYLINDIMSDSASGMEVDFVFIMSPEADRKDEFFDIIREMNFRTPVLCDFDHEFESNNLLADNDLYNTFLVDRDNKIVVVGSPVYNSALWTFYRQRIQRLNEEYAKKQIKVKA